MQYVTQFFEWGKMLLQAADLLPDFTSARGIFCAIAWTATLLSVVSMVMAFFFDFGDSDVDVPAVEASDAAGADTGVFSVRAVIGFMMGFGWGGYAAVQSGAGVGLAILVGLLVGLVIFFCVVALLKFIYSLKCDGSLDYNTLVGCTGTVYLTIPPHGEPGGQVQISHPSQMITMAAVQEGDTPLPAQTPIVVVAATTYCLTVRSLAAPKTPQQ